MFDRIRVARVHDHSQMHRVVQATLVVTSGIRLVGKGANGHEGIVLCEQGKMVWLAPMTMGTHRNARASSA